MRPRPEPGPKLLRLFAAILLVLFHWFVNELKFEPVSPISWV